MRPLPPWAGRAAACLILLAVLLLLKLVAVDPLVDAYASSADEIRRLAELSQRYRALAGRLPALAAERDALVRQTAAGGGFIESANETLAAADLQARLKTLVDQAHGELRSTQILPVEQVQGFRRVGVRAEMAMTLPALQQVLYQTEASSPILVLDDLSIRSRAADRQEERNPDVVLLTASVDIYGFLKGAQ